MTKKDEKLYDALFEAFMELGRRKGWAEALGTVEILKISYGNAIKYEDLREIDKNVHGPN